MTVSIYQLANGKWRADVAVAGVRRSKVWRLKAEAADWARSAERDLLLDSAPVAGLARRKVRVSVGELLRRYADEESGRKRGAVRERLRIAHLLAVLPFVELPIDVVTAGHFERWADEAMGRAVRPLSAASVLRTYSLLGAVFEFARLRGWVGSNVVRDARKPAKPEHRERRVLAHEVELILHGLGYEIGNVPKNKSQEVGLIWLIALATGMRSGEIVNRLRGEVCVAGRYVSLPAGEVKSGRGRQVPLDELALKLWQLALMIRPRGRAFDRVFSVSDASRDALWRKARRVAELDDADLHFHDSRHEAASLMAKRLPNALMLCKIFGWKDPRYALVYYNPTVVELADQLDAAKQFQVVGDFLLSG